MPTLPGKPPGPYQIPSAIRAGATGEVCHTRDARLDRLASFKLPPAYLAERVELHQLERKPRPARGGNHPLLSALPRQKTSRDDRRCESYGFPESESQNRNSELSVTWALRVTSLPVGKGQP
jgi:hypothetical protein